MQPRDIPVPPLIGDIESGVTEGLVELTFNGTTIRMRPITTRPGRLWFIFRDATAGQETYEAARFLYADLKADGTTVLDFNEAYNPPCAFNEFTTCPLPLPENRLTVRIPAGELAYADGDVGPPSRDRAPLPRSPRRRRRPEIDPRVRCQRRVRRPWNVLPAAAARGVRPAVVWHSGKLRAKQTAEAFWRACNALAEFSATRDLQPDDPPSWIRVSAARRIADILIAGHFIICRGSWRCSPAATTRRASLFTASSRWRRRMAARRGSRDGGLTRRPLRYEGNHEGTLFFVPSCLRGYFVSRQPEIIGTPPRRTPPPEIDLADVPEVRLEQLVEPDGPEEPQVSADAEVIPEIAHDAAAEDSSRSCCPRRR